MDVLYKVDACTGMLITRTKTVAMLKCLDVNGGVYDRAFRT